MRSPSLLVFCVFAPLACAAQPDADRVAEPAPGVAVPDPDQPPPVPGWPAHSDLLARLMRDSVRSAIQAFEAAVEKAPRISVDHGGYESSSGQTCWYEVDERGEFAPEPRRVPILLGCRASGGGEGEERSLSFVFAGDSLVALWESVSFSSGGGTDVIVQPSFAPVYGIRELIEPDEEGELRYLDASGYQEQVGAAGSHISALESRLCSLRDSVRVSAEDDPDGEDVFISLSETRSYGGGVEYPSTETWTVSRELFDVLGC